MKCVSGKGCYSREKAFEFQELGHRGTKKMEHWSKASGSSGLLFRNESLENHGRRVSGEARHGVRSCKWTYRSHQQRNQQTLHVGLKEESPCLSELMEVTKPQFSYMLGVRIED